MKRIEGTTLAAAALTLSAALGLTPGCRGKEEARTGAQGAAQGPVEPAGPPPPEVQAAVQGVLDTGRHPWLSWPEVTGGLADLKALYAAEPDGLFWFAGESPHPALAGALETLRDADAQGLDPADYDAKLLLEKWEATRAGGATSAADRALFDVALTASAMRLLQSVHGGRVDPRLVGFDYDVSAKRLDLAAALRSARDGGGLPAAVAAAEPQFPVYHRLVKALADYRARAAAGEPPPVPALAAKQKKVEPGKPWAGAPALDARLRAFGDLAGTPRRLETADGEPPLLRCAGGRGQALPAPSRPRARRCARARHDPGAQRLPGAPRAADRAGPRARALAPRDAHASRTSS